LSPFNADAVDYSQLISYHREREEEALNSATADEGRASDEQAVAAIENLISSSDLRQMEEARKANLDWSGEVALKALYDVWRQLKNKLSK
jgi:hypothetical protein